jgi:hypothetical protein
MRKPRIKSMLFLVLAGSTATGMVVAGAIKTHPITALTPTVKQESKKTRQADERAQSHQEIPIADYNAPEPKDPVKRTLRRTKSSRHNVKDPSVKPQEISKLALTESSAPINLGGPWSHSPEESAIPVAESDAVLIGDVTEAAAYLSTDKTSVYSEFALAVAEVLKDSKADIPIGEAISAQRSGGGVRFASGKVLIRGLLGKPLPKKGARYVFFLKRNEDVNDFSILTAYELRGGQVFPLDGLTPKGDVIPPFAAYQQYKGMDQGAFLAKVRDLIQAQPRPQEREGQE